jgi:hypothetical protein
MRRIDLSQRSRNNARPGRPRNGSTTMLHRPSRPPEDVPDLRRRLASAQPKDRLMHLFKPVLAAAGAAVLVVGVAVPAFADDTATTFTLTGGEITLSVAASATLTNEASSVAANVITGTLGAVVVTDSRGGTSDWIVTAASSTFTGNGLSVSDDVRYTNGTVTTSGTSTLAPATGLSIASVDAVAGVTGVSGNNTASWNPTLDVSMPAGALAGDYAGTVTTSLA